MSTFPSAVEYYNALPEVMLGDAAIGVQPASQFPISLGVQPEGLRNADVKNGTRRKVLVIAGGDVWRKFSRCPLNHRGAEYFLFDPDLYKEDAPDKPGRKSIEEKRKIAGVDDAHCVESLDRLPKGIDYCVIEPAPEFHTQYILWAQKQRLPAMVEKPLVADTSEFNVLDKALSAPSAPLFCMDWEAAHAGVLAAVIGSATGNNKVPFADAVKFVQGKERFSDFNFNDIRHISASLVEAPDGLGGMDYVKQNRPDIYRQGVLKDMGVHPLAALASIGFKPGEVTHVTLGDTEKQKELGVYRHIGNGETAPAWYARGELNSAFRGQNIPTTIEVAKSAAESEAHISLTDDKGRELRWSFGAGNALAKPPVASRNTVELFDRDGKKPLAVATCEVDPYALMFEQARLYFDEQKGKDHIVPLYYQEQKDVLHAVAEMEKKGRTSVVQPEDVVRQKALEPAETVDLNHATVTAPETLKQL